MTDISHVASAPGSTTATTSDTVIVPAVLVNDFLILACTNRGSANSPTVTDDDVTGNTWARLDNAQNNGGSVWFKRATADTSGKTITAAGFTTACTIGLSVYRDVPSDTAEQITIQSLAAGEETVSGLTPSRPNSLFCFFNHNRNSGTTTNSPSGANCGLLAERYDVNNTTNANSCEHASLLVSDATGDIAWGQSNSIHPIIMLILTGPQQSATVYSGDGFARSDFHHKRLQDQTNKLDEARRKRDDERAQLKIDLRAVAQSMQAAPDVVRESSEAVALARRSKNVVSRPTAALFPLIGSLRNTRRFLDEVRDAEFQLEKAELERVRAAAKAALEAEQRAILVAAYEQIVAEMAAEEDDEDAMVMILAQVA